jgi:hypothetical protein
VSALFAFILDTFVFLKLRGIVRERASSTSMASADQERKEKYEHRLARQMLLFPVCVHFKNSSNITDMMGLTDCIHDYDSSTYYVPLCRMGRP